MSCYATDDAGCNITEMHLGESNIVRSIVVIDAVGDSNDASGAVNNASDGIDICGDAKGTMGGAKNGPDAEPLMKETTPKKEGSTKRLCESVGCVNTDAVVCIKHSYNARPQVDEDAENGEIDVAVCL